VERNSGVWLLAFYLFLAVYLLPMFPHGGSANELTRWATAASLVETRSFEISWTEPLIGRNVDTARVDNRLYSNKGPGIAVLAAPLYAIVRTFVGPPDASNIRVTWFVMRFVLSSLPLFLLGLWLYRKGADELSLATLMFATPLFVYSLLFFSHVLVAVLIYFAFRLIYDKDPIESKNCFWAGIASGLAVVCEFPALIPVAILGPGILFTNKEKRAECFGQFVLGGVPFAVLLMLYNYALFGSPFSMSYAYETFPEWAEVAGQGVFGIGFPSLSAAYLLLFSPSRGLLFTAPILALAIVLFFTSRDRSSLRHRVKIAAIVVTILLMCGHGAAHGGWAFSARYLIMIVPLMLDSFFERKTEAIPSFWTGLLFSISLILSVVPALTFPFAPPEFNAPHNDFWTKLLVRENWVVPNLANVFGVETSVWLMLPVIVAIVICVAIVGRSMRLRVQFVAGLVLGIVAVTTYLSWPGLDSDEDAFRRATIAERYFRPGDRLNAVNERAVQSRDWTTLRRVNNYEWNIADTRAYAPNDFPYLKVQPLGPSPSKILRQALEMQNRGDANGAEKLLTNAKSVFPFANCEFATSLAVIYYTTNRKDAALRDLEAIQPLVNPASLPQCARSQYFLGSLYKEMSRSDDAENAFRQFISNTDGSTDPEIVGFRKSLKSPQ
jgi:hypothetical protein